MSEYPFWHQQGFCLRSQRQDIAQLSLPLVVKAVELHKFIVIENLKKEGIANVEVIAGDGSEGIAGKAPFDRIILSCACPFIPKKLFSDLSEGGRIVAPVGDQHTQILEIMIREKGKPVKKSFDGSLFAFVPMKGKHGFS